MNHLKISRIGITGLSVGILALIAWLYFIQGAAGDHTKEIQQEPESFIPSETISPHQAVAFPTDI